MRLASILLAGGLCWSSVLADWPQFRGPLGQGHSNAVGLPNTWSEEENVSWKVPVPGAGHSSPSVLQGQVWVTSATQDGKSLHAFCFSSDDGKLLHDVPLFQLEDLPESHGKNGYASPTAVLDEEAAYVHFGAVGTASVKRSTGEVLWKTQRLEYRQPYAGASSPVLYEDLLILSCDGTDHQFLVALHRKTGKVVWKTPRGHLEETRRNPDKRWPGGMMLMAYSTPLVIDVAGVPQLVSPAAEHVAAYDARSGKELWWLAYRGFSEVARPVYAHGVLVVLGFEEVAERTLFAMRADGSGDVTKTHLLWKRRRSVPHVPSPIVVGKDLYLINDGGIATCVDLATGKEHWQARIGGNISASPIHADGKLYICTEDGKTAVVAPSRTEYKLLATNQLDGQLLASPAVAGDALFLRSDTHLYRVAAAD